MNKLSVYIVFSGLDPAVVCNSSAIIKKIFPFLYRLKMDGGSDVGSLFDTYSIRKELWTQFKHFPNF